MAVTVPPWHCPTGLTDAEQAEVDSRLPITLYHEKGDTMPKMPPKPIKAKPSNKPSASDKLTAVKPKTKYSK